MKTREKLEAAKKKTSFEIAELKERLKASRETINCLKNEIRKLEEDDQSKDMWQVLTCVCTENGKTSVMELYELSSVMELRLWEFHWQMTEVCGNQLHKWKKKERMYPYFIVKICGYSTIYFKWKWSWRPDYFYFENCIWVVYENFVLSLVLVQCDFTKCWCLLFLLFFFYWLFSDASLKLKIKYAVFYFNVFCLCSAEDFKSNCK